MNFQLILSPFFLKPHPPLSVTSNNMLIKMNFSKHVPILVINLIKPFLAIVPIL